MKKPEAYLQAENGEEAELEVTTCDPDDGSFVVHLTDEAFDLLNEAVNNAGTVWVRIVPSNDE